LEEILVPDLGLIAISCDVVNEQSCAECREEQAEGQPHFGEVL